MLAAAKTHFSNISDTVQAIVTKIGRNVLKDPTYISFDISAYVHYGNATNLKHFQLLLNLNFEVASIIWTG